MNDVSIRLDGSAAYQHALAYWHPLLLDSAAGQPDGPMPVFAEFVRLSLLPAMRHERDGKQVLRAISASGATGEALVTALAAALLERDTAIRCQQKSRLAHWRALLLSPLFLTAVITLSLVAAIHVHAARLGIGEELKVLYLSPLLNIGMMFFVAPLIYQLLRKILK